MNTLSEVKVWDPLVRLFHWSLVIVFAIAYLSGEEWMDLHAWAGYVVVGLLGFRLIWGLVGSRYARFSDFVYPPRVVIAYLKEVFALKAVRYLGHNPAGGAMIVVLLFSLLLTTTSGLAVYGADQWQGPMAGLLKNLDDSWIHVLEESHEFLANMTLVLIAIHVGGVVWESLLHKENLAKSMVTGRKQA